jgi:ATP-dependent Lon protease
MPIPKKQPKSAAYRKYRRSKQDPPESESSSSSCSESESEVDESESQEEEWETEEDDDETVSTASPPKKGKIDKSEFLRLLSSLYPSNYISKKVNDATKTCKSDSKCEERDPAEELNKAQRRLVKKTSDLKQLIHILEEKLSIPKSKNRSRKAPSEEDEEESAEDVESEEYTEDDAPSTRKSKKPTPQKYNIIFGIKPNDDDLDDDDDEYTDDDDEGYPEEVDEDEECNSDDEATFMKEKYEKIDAPAPASPKKKNKAKLVQEVDATDAKESAAATKATEEPEFEDIEKEYLELLELKKQFTSQLKAKPNNRILRDSIDACKEEIQELVKHARHANTKLYHSLVHNESNKTDEMDYFKKKLSNKEQLLIMKDLKEINRHMYIEKPYRLALLQSKMPPKFKAIAMQKLNVLASMSPGDNEYYKIKNWVDAFIRIPFGIYRHLTISIHDGIDECNQFLANAKNTLDTCVYGLNDAKLQIMQMLGQWMVNPNALGTAIAIHGPPGTGKTSIVKDGISKILGREFAFIALGGGGDSSFLEGHSYTYEGSTWGKIVQILMDCKSMNPVIYFDELDKISDTSRGQEIIGILTHLTDTTQNSQFHDKYFADIDFDISKCLFIFSYNDEQLVNPILRDRMYRIKTKGYDTKDKIVIAKNYLLPKIREQVSFSETDVVIPDDTLNYIITSPHLTKGESGVRNLKRCLEIIYTKLNLFRLIKPENLMFQKEMEMKVVFPITITRKEVDVFIKNDETVNQTLLSMYI